MGGIILGGADIVNWIKRNYLSNDSDTKEKPQLKRLQQRPTPEDLVAVFYRKFNCTRAVVMQKGKKGNLVRDLAIYLSKEMTGKAGLLWVTSLVYPELVLPSGMALSQKIL